MELAVRTQEIPLYYAALFSACRSDLALTVILLLFSCFHQMERRSSAITKQPRELQMFTWHEDPRARAPWLPGAMVHV
jgi:hypothetical protein